MNIIKLYIFSLFIIILSTVCVNAQGVSDESTIVDSLDYYNDESGNEKSSFEARPSADSTKIETRSFDEATIERFKSDSEFDYGSDSPAVYSLWDRIKRWLGEILSLLFYFGESTTWGNFLVMILVVVILIYVIIRLMKIDTLKFFYSGKGGPVKAYTVIEENIHEMDFDKLIADALSDKDYRLAIRLTFLLALKLLSDNHLVDWQPGKTNHDYLHELRSEALKPGFDELNYYFEYAWYGNFNIPVDLYKKVSTKFLSWKEKVS